MTAIGTFLYDICKTYDNIINILILTRKGIAQLFMLMLVTAYHKEAKLSPSIINVNLNDARECECYILLGVKIDKLEISH